MKILKGILGLTLMLNFCESRGNDLLIVSTEIDDILANEPRDSFSNPFNHLSDSEKKHVCVQVNSAKLVISFITNNPVYEEKNQYLSKLINLDKYNPIVGNTFINYKEYSLIPTLSCESSQSFIQITMNNKSKVLYVFLKKPYDITYTVHAIFTTYFGIGQIRKYPNGLFKRPSNTKVLINLKHIILCASLFEHLSLDEMENKVMYAVKSSFSITSSLPLPPFVHQNYRKMTHDLMCDGFEYNGHAIGPRFIVHFVSLFSLQDEPGKMKKLLVVSHDEKFTVMYDTMQ